MPNAWVEHVKDFAKKNGISYPCAISNVECKNSYVSPAKLKKINETIPNNTIKINETIPNNTIKINETIPNSTITLKPDYYIKFQHKLQKILDQIRMSQAALSPQGKIEGTAIGQKGKSTRYPANIKKMYREIFNTNIIKYKELMGEDYGYDINSKPITEKTKRIEKERILRDKEKDAQIEKENKQREEFYRLNPQPAFDFSQLKKKKKPIYL